MNTYQSAEQKTDYGNTPWIIFTDSQVAGVGLDEQVVTAQNIPFEITKLPLQEIPGSVPLGIPEDLLSLFALKIKKGLDITLF